jgi:carnitine-CoA ligase
MNESVTGRQLWRRRCEETPNRTFLYASHRSWTIGDFDDAQRRYAAGFAAVGVGRGQRVAVAMSNGAQALLVLFALQELGAVAVPLRADLSAADLAVRINRSQALCLVADDPAAGRLLPRIDDLPLLRTVVSDVTGPCRPRVTVAALAELANHGPMAPADIPGHCERDLAMVLSKSSRAGRPTTVALSAGMFGHVGRTFAQHFGIRGSDNFFLPLTIGHGVGALLAPAVATWAGCALTVVPDFSASTFWHQVREHAATVSVLFPEHLHLLMGAAATAPEAGQTSLRQVITPVYMDSFQRRFGVEMSTLVCQAEAQDPPHRLDAEGSTVRNDPVMSELSDGHALECVCPTSMVIAFDRGDRPPRRHHWPQRKVFSA